MNVNSVEQGTGDPLLIFRHERGRAGTGFLCIAIVSTRTGVHRGNKLKIRGKSQRPLGTANGHNFIFHRLAHHFENTRAEFRELVQKQYPSVGQGYFTRFRNISSTHQTCIGKLYAVANEMGDV